MDADRNKLVELGFKVEDIDIKLESADSLKQKLFKIDIVFFAGGNTTYLLQKIKDSGLDVLISDFLAQDKIFIGSSAGSIIAGPSIEPYVEGELAELPRDFKLLSPYALSLVDFIILPHYDQEKYLAENKQILEKFGDKYKIRTLQNNEAILINGDKEELVRVN